jgi:transketolase
LDDKYLLTVKKFNYAKDENQLRFEKAFHAYRNGKSEEKTRLQKPHSHQKDQKAEKEFDPFRPGTQGRRKQSQSFIGNVIFLKSII